MKDLFARIISAFIRDKARRKLFRDKLRRPNSFIRLINKNYMRVKLGVSYNLFDGEELLPANLKNIRSVADHISVVYQTTSNFGNAADKSVESMLNQLVLEGLIDTVYHYDPDMRKSASWNETTKRNIGVRISAENGCTHFINCDVDEFYFQSQIELAKCFIEDNDISISAVTYSNYIQKPIYREKTIAGYVPFICKIDKGVSLGNCYFPCRVDPTRTVESSGKFYIFEPRQVMMHHMTTIRSDIRKKMSNSTFNQVNKNEYSRYSDYFLRSSNFKYGISTDFDVEVVENYFEIEL